MGTPSGSDSSWQSRYGAPHSTDADRPQPTLAEADFAIATMGLIVWVLNCYRNALCVVRGQAITFTDFFRFRGLGAAFMVHLLVSLILVAGAALFYIPGFIAGIILLFAVPAAFHIRDCSVGDAFATTWRVVTGNIVRVVLLFLLAGVLNFLGGLVIIGVIITTPMMYLIYAHALQTAIGGPISQRV